MSPQIFPNRPVLARPHRLSQAQPRSTRPEPDRLSQDLGAALAGPAIGNRRSVSGGDWRFSAVIPEKSELERLLGGELERTAMPLDSLDCDNSVAHELLGGVLK
eukprot:14992564-Heterocapsa_arctica.AAC.1